MQAASKFAWESWRFGLVYTTINRNALWNAENSRTTSVTSLLSFSLWEILAGEGDFASGKAKSTKPSAACCKTKSGYSPQRDSAWRNTAERCQPETSRGHQKRSASASEASVRVPHPCLARDTGVLSERTGFRGEVVLFFFSFSLLSFFVVTIVVVRLGSSF